MNSDLQQALELVESLNEELYSIAPTLVEEGYSFQLTTDATSFVIQFGDTLLYSSENDGRSYLEKEDRYEDLRIYLLRQLVEQKNNFTAGITILQREISKLIQL